MLGSESVEPDDAAVEVEAAPGRGPGGEVVADPFDPSQPNCQRRKQRGQFGGQVPGSGPPRAVDVPRDGRLGLQPQTRFAVRRLGGLHDQRGGDGCVRARLHAGAPVPGR